MNASGIVLQKERMAVITEQMSCLILLLNAGFKRKRSPDSKDPTNRAFPSSAQQQVQAGDIANADERLSMSGSMRKKGKVRAAP